MTEIMLVSGSRADAGALTAVKEALIRAGVTVRWFNCAPPTTPADDREAVAHDTAMACRKTARELALAKVDLVVLHGDRYEILGAATAAFLMGVPIAHLGGGDVTEGSQDDSIRHAITKLSHLHFVTCDGSGHRVAQMGEEHWRIHCVGDPGIDHISHNSFLSRTETLKALKMPYKVYFLVAYHPNTLGDTKTELDNLSEAIRCARKLMPEVGIVLLDPNKDVGYHLIERRFRNLSRMKGVRYHVNLHRSVYLSALKHAVALVGNSSAALYEAPTTGTLTVLLGDRQKGRIRASNCIANVNSIGELLTAMQTAAQTTWTNFTFYNPYGDGKAAERIVEILRKTDLKSLLRKRFQCLTLNGKEFTPPRSGADTPRKSSSNGLHVPSPEQLTDQKSESLIWGLVQGLPHGSLLKKDSG